MGTLQRLVFCLQHSDGFRRLSRPFDDTIRNLVFRTPRILAGPMRGLYYGSGDGDRSVLLGTYEPGVQQAMRDVLKKGHVFYDIGANAGYFSLLGATLVGPEGHVYAFEPLPQNGERLKKTMEENQVRNYTLVMQAVNDASGTRALYLGDGNQRRASLLPWKGEARTFVDTITLDQFVRDDNWPNLIKLDVEGAEIQVLQGGRRVLSDERAPIWIIEIHSEKNDRAAGELLDAHQYRMTRRAQENRKGRRYPLHMIARKE